jgi:hypothetical protein
MKSAAGRKIQTLPLVLVLAILFTTASSVLGKSTFVTPESTLAAYIQALQKGDKAAVERCFVDPGDFYLPGPLSIEKYTIKKKVIVGPQELSELAALLPPAQSGDVRLDVEQTMEKEKHMFSYAFRKTKSGWKIYSHSAWDGPE